MKIACAVLRLSCSRITDNWYLLRLKIFRKALNCRADCHRREITQRTETFTVNLAGNRLQEFDIGSWVVVLTNAFDNMLHPIRAVAAGRTFATRLMFKEVD